MPAPIGNPFWKSRTSHGKGHRFQSPDQLWDACVEYFEWVEDNPLLQEEHFPYQGTFIIGVISKMRAMTIGGLCLHLKISRSTWYNYKQSNCLSDVTEKVESVIYEQKFTGAAAGLLNPVIIARELSLRSRVHSGQ